MIVRGAMAIGVSAAMGVALGIERSTATTIVDLDQEVDVICETLAKTRPTAVNLFWGIAQVRELYNELAAKKTPIPEIKREVVVLAKRLYDEDIANLRRLGAFGAELLPQERHRADALQCGRAGGVRVRIGAGRHSRCRGDRQEDRCVRGRDAAVQSGNAAYRMGAAEGQAIPTTLICDNRAGYFMGQGRIQAVIVGADRIAANGDTANKIGTYSVAILAKEHGIPFYVAAPFNTIDPETPTGREIPIEQRDAREVTHLHGRRVTPEGVAIENPAFDVTPAKYISAIITERCGVLRAPFAESIAAARTSSEYEPQAV